MRPEPSDRESLWNGERGAGGISWVDRSRMGPIRGVIDAADTDGRRNTYIHTLHRRVVETELKSVAPLHRALDFGCGTGRFLRTLYQYSTSVYAIDKEPSMVEAARHYAGRFAKRIECWKAERTPYQPAFFDFVLCSSVLCVTTRDLFDRSLQEIARVSRFGATLLLLEQVTIHRDLAVERYRAALMKAQFEVVRIYPIRPANSALTRLVTKNTWIPEPAFAALAAIETGFIARSADPSSQPYVEHAFVARRL